MSSTIFLADLISSDQKIGQKEGNFFFLMKKKNRQWC